MESKRLQYLEQVSRSDSACWYRLGGDYQGDIQRWLVSTPETVRVCNAPELLGVEFSRTLRIGLTAAVRSAPFLPLLRSVSEGRLCIMNFLRGSLNFGLRDVLHDALGSNLHATCFMSSQRFREDGRWHVKEDMYRKIRVPEGAVLLVGDVVATGVTADNGLEVIEQHLRDHNSSIKALVFFTLGCHKIEKILEDYHQRFARAFPGYEATHVIYLEAKFRLVDSSTKLVIGIPGTDLIKRGALLSPELELAQYDSLSVPLERCIIYDAGSRSFDVREYLADVVEYWEQVRRLARRGYTLRDALHERWPEDEYAGEERLITTKREQWRSVPDALINQLWQRYRRRWDAAFTNWAASNEALEQVSSERLALLRAVMARLEKEAGSA